MIDAKPVAYRAQYHQSSDCRWVLCSVTTDTTYPEDTSEVCVVSVQLGYGMIIARCLDYSFIEAAGKFHDFKPESVL